MSQPVTVSRGALSLKPAGHGLSPIYFIAPRSTRSRPFRPVWFTDTFTYLAELVVPLRSLGPWARTAPTRAEYTARPLAGTFRRNCCTNNLAADLPLAVTRLAISK